MSNPKELLLRSLPQGVARLRARLASSMRALGFRLKSSLQLRVHRPNEDEKDSQRAPQRKRRNGWVQTQLAPIMRKSWKQVKARFITASLITAVLILLGCGGLGMLYFRQQGDREALIAQLDVSKRNLRRYGTEESRIERTENARAILATGQDYFPESRTSADILGDILKLARESEVQIDQIEAYSGKGEQTDTGGCSALSVNLQAKGDMSELQSFLAGLENGSVKATSIDRVTIGGAHEAPIASISISAYGR